jgi:hypothetical protein
MSLVSHQNLAGVNGIIEMMQFPPLNGSGEGRPDPMGGIGGGHLGNGGLPSPDGCPVLGFFLFFILINGGAI